jgi:hypothetical protein
VRRLHEVKEFSRVLTSLGIKRPVVNVVDHERERIIADRKKKRGHDVYMVKGEILYKFGNLFTKWEDVLERVQKESYKFIE